MANKKKVSPAPTDNTSTTEDTNVGRKTSIPPVGKPTSLIRSSGTQQAGALLRTANGSEFRSNYFEALEALPDDYSSLDGYTPEERGKIQNHLQHLSTGAASATPMECNGSTCPFADRCPFIRADRARRLLDGNLPLLTPIGKQCLTEINLLNEWTRLYVQEYDITENSFTEILMARELAEIELLTWRLNNNLAKPENAELVQEVAVGVDSRGEPVMRQELNAFMEAKDRLAVRKSRLVKLLVGDRQEKYKREAALKVTDENDASISAARLRQKINQLLKEAERSVLALKDTEVIDVDEFSPDQLIARGGG